MVRVEGFESNVLTGKLEKLNDEAAGTAERLAAPRREAPAREPLERSPSRAIPPAQPRSRAPQSGFSRGEAGWV